MPVSKSLPFPTDLRTLERFLHWARQLLIRTENAIRRAEQINQLAAARRQLEEHPVQQQPTPESALSERRNRVEARLNRLSKPVERLHEDLAAFRSELTCALSGLPVEDPDLAALRSRVEALRWPSAPGFRKPLLEPARNNLREIVLALARTTQAKACKRMTRSAVLAGTPSAVTVEEGCDDVLTLAEAAKYLKVSYQRAAELVRKRVLPAFRLGRQVRIRRRDLEELMQRGGLGE